jgi:hypothetical protein
MKRTTYFLFAIIFILLVIQFIRPEKNNSGDLSEDIGTAYEVPENVKSILQRSCNDCHSNKTEYPWYAEVQPVGWWLNSHVKDGKRHLNLNHFMALKVAQQKKKLEECMEQIKADNMPLNSYTWIHKDAEISEADKQTIYAWCQKIIDAIVAKYPADSLVLKKERWHE